MSETSPIVPGVRVHPLARCLRELAVSMHYEKHTSNVIRPGDPPRIGFFDCDDSVCSHVVETLEKYGTLPPESDEQASPISAPEADAHA